MTESPIMLPEQNHVSAVPGTERSAWNTASVDLETAKGTVCIQSGLVPYGKREHPLEAKLAALEARQMGVHSIEYEGFVNVFNHEKELIAGVQLQRRWNSCKLFSLWVDDAYRGAGIGEQILMVAQELCLNMGAEVLMLETSTLHNVQFYLNRGFNVVAELGDVIPGEQFYLLHKNLVQQQAQTDAINDGGMNGF